MLEKAKLSILIKPQRLFKKNIKIMFIRFSLNFLDVASCMVYLAPMLEHGNEKKPYVVCIPTLERGNEKNSRCTYLGCLLFH